MILQAGAAKVEITPQRLGLRLGGHAVNRRAVGVHDPLLARVVALSDGSAPLVIAALDLVGLMRGWVEKIRDRLPDLDRTRIWVCTTHTHDGPDTLGFWGPMIAGVPLRSGLDAEYQEFVIDRTVQAVREAVEALEPARLTAATVQTPAVGLSRNVRQEGLKDDSVQIIRLVDRRGRGLAFLYNYACHPEFMGHHNKLISAGWPGVTSARLERRFGGVALLLQNALGGMVTGAVSRDDGAFDPMVGQPFVRRMGLALAEEIIRGMRENNQPIEVDAIRTAQRVFFLPVENRLFRLAARLNVFPRWMMSPTREIQTEVNLARLGPIGIATLPGEALPDVGFAVKQKLGARYPWVAALANDELGYLLSPECWRDARYSYEKSMSIGGGAVPIILGHLDQLLQQM